MTANFRGDIGAHCDPSGELAEWQSAGIRNQEPSDVMTASGIDRLGAHARRSTNDSHRKLAGMRSAGSSP